MRLPPRLFQLPGVVGNHAPSIEIGHQLRLQSRRGGATCPESRKLLCIRRGNQDRYRRIRAGGFTRCGTRRSEWIGLEDEGRRRLIVGGGHTPNSQRRPVRTAAIRSSLVWPRPPLPSRLEATEG